MDIIAFLLIAFIAIGLLMLLADLFFYSKEKREEKEELLARLATLKDRINNYEEIVKELKKLPSKELKIQVEALITKNDLIDDIEKYKGKVSNYDEITSRLDAVSKNNSVQEKEAHASILFKLRRMKKLLYLTEKYGSDIAKRLINHEYFLGMTKEQLEDCIGSPSKTEKEVGYGKKKEVFVYGDKKTGNIFEFEDGKLDKFLIR